MVHTLPDYTTKYKMTKVFAGLDLAELSARLGALSTLDRRGNLVWFDDFEAAALKWYPSLTAGGTAAVSTTRACMGNQSMKLYAPTITSGTAAIIKMFNLPIERKIATEFMFHLEDGKPIVEHRITGFTGTYYFDAFIRYNHNTRKLYYYNSAHEWVELTMIDCTELATYEPWFLMKLVVDWDIKEYIRLTFGSTEYDLSGISMHSGGSTLPKHVDVSIYNSLGSAADATVYIDNFILTQNE